MESINASDITHGDDDSHSRNSCGFKAHVDVDNCFWLKPVGEFVNPPTGPPAFTTDHFQLSLSTGTYVPISGLGLPDFDLVYWCLNTPNSKFLQ